MSCLECQNLSKESDHLSSDYLKKIKSENPETYTCKANHPFCKTWVFGFGKLGIPENGMMCGGHYFTEQKGQLTLF